MFRKSITKEELGEVPVGQYDGKIVLIEHREDVPKVMASVQQCAVCGIDTESLPSFKKGQFHPVALLQIATDNAVFLIRINKTGVTPEIIHFFASPDVRKIGIALKDDMHRLNRNHSIQLSNFIDLNDYCTQMGFESIGAKKLSALVLGFKVSKNQQTSNWELPKLSEAQKKYAATDAWICREIYLKLTHHH